MTTADMIIEKTDPALSSEFAGEIARQMRAIDTYGTYDNSENAEILDPFIMTKERKREIPVVGDPDEITLARVKAYYNSLAVMIEKRTELMAVPMINLTHEGFGRAIVSVGKLIVIDRTLRDVHRFGFASLAKMQEEANKLVEKAVALIEANIAVAKL